MEDEQVKRTAVVRKRRVVALEETSDMLIKASVLAIGEVSQLGKQLLHWQLSSAAVLTQVALKCQQ